MLERLFFPRIPQASTPAVFSRGFAHREAIAAGAHPGHRVRLRSLKGRDRDAWRDLRIRNEAALRPVEPTLHGDWVAGHSEQSWALTLQHYADQAQRGTLMPFAIEVDGSFAGQLTFGDISRHSDQNCWVGYWIDDALAGRGIATAALALGIDFAFSHHTPGKPGSGLGLHRIQATVLPSNTASRRVLARTGFREEGYLRRNLHINGAWRDHILVAQTVEDVTESPLPRDLPLADAGSAPDTCGPREGVGNATLPASGAPHAESGATHAESGAPTHASSGPATRVAQLLRAGVLGVAPPA